MANTIKCPVCGEVNPDGQEFCQNCQSRLQPPSEAKGADSSFKAGQAPTKKNTAELEPILPQWLRDARDSSRNAGPQESTQVSQNSEQKQPAASEDLLAGLSSQSDNDEEDDTPDWLASITGTTAKAKKSPTEPTGDRRIELGNMGDFAQEDPAEESETPSWLAGLTPNESLADQKDELTDWFRNADDSKPMESPKESSSFADTFPPATEDDTPDWLKQMSADEDAKKVQQAPSFGTTSNTFPAESSDTPDWLRQMAAAADDQSSSFDAPSNAPPTDDIDTPDWLRQMAAADDQTLAFDAPSNANPTSDADAPDWLKQMSAEAQTLSFEAPSNEIPAGDTDTPDWLRQMETVENLNTPPASGDVYNDAPELSIEGPDWLRGMEEKPQSADSPVDAGSGSGKSEPPALVSTGELPSWLNDQVDNAPPPTQETTPKWLKKEAPASVTGELPAWLASSEETVRIPSTPKEKAPSEPVQAQNDALGDLPDWLKASAPQSTLFEEPAQVSAAEPADASFDTPDWLNTFKSVEEEPQPAPASEKEIPFDMPSAFVAENQSAENVDSLFTEMPDWLSNAMDLPDSPTPITNTDAIAPGELPSWVQAMRPVDEAPSSLSSSLSFAGLSSDQTLESRGALAGLQGVLPAVPGFTPTSKPKPYSIRLQASDEQLAHAELLEQILAAETAPVPIASFSSLRTSRSLRWFLLVVVFAAVVSGLMLGTPLFSLPVGVPREIGSAMEISRSLPQGAPVLVAFDYEAARVGEMEAAAAPFFDQMILNSHPNFTFISSNESGSLLAERFVAGPLADHYKNSGFTYSNLGYLPGGQLGIRAFAQWPRSTSPLDMYLQPAWASTPNELTSLPQLFMAMVLITDNADAARAWIEQTQDTRGSLPVIVITSAQAAPMIQPYYESQQVRGMVAGLYGGAVFEQNKPGTIKTARNYWNAYSLGMLLAMSLVLGGGLWNFVLGLRDRASAREAK